ncbi:MAG: hypothetical protein J6U54_07205 [Clostridiales bacterium]|nr:hypothetical protein [Clostridiales bacterium]
MQTLSKIVSKTLSLINKHGGLILSIGAGACTVGAVIAVADATAKTMTKVQKKRTNEMLKIVDRTIIQGRNPDIHKIVDTISDDEFKLTTSETVKIWALPTGLTAGALICIACNHKLNAQKQAALLAFATSSAYMFNSYRTKAMEIYDDIDDKVVDEIVNSDDIYFDISDYFAHHGISSEEVVTFYDENVGGYFETTPNQFLRAIYHLQREIVQKGYISLTTFYNFLNQKPDHKHKNYCDIYGWDQHSICEAISSGWLDIHIEPKIIENLEGESDMVIYEYYMDFEPVDLRTEWIIT